MEHMGLVSKMTDKQLLKLAAKAYGFVEIIFRDGADDDGYDNGIWTYTWVKNPSGELIYWNPLDDGGDALQLAVKLQMRVSVLEFKTEIIAAMSRVDIAELHGNDKYAATRRAIVRAAAELGSKLK